MPGLVVTEDTMNWKRGIIATVCMLMLSVTLAASDSWLHIRVEERGRGGENISVNIPLALVEALIPAIETEEFNRGRIHIGDADLDGIDLHEILLAVRDAPDADYVKIQGDGEEVRVSKERGFLIVNVDEDRGDRVRVRLPLDVVDALVGEGSEELDLVAALDVLARHHKGDLVSVESDDESIRIWIDNSDSGD